MINDKFEGEDVALAAAAKPWEARRAVAYFAGRVTGQPHMHAQGTHLVNPRLRTAEIAVERWGCCKLVERLIGRVLTNWKGVEGQPFSWNLQGTPKNL